MNITNDLTHAQVKLLTGAEVAIACMVYKDVDPDGEPITEADVYDQRLMDEASWPERDDRCACCGARIIYACMAVELATMRGFYLGRTCAHHIENLAMMDSVQALSLKRRAQATHRIAALIRDRPRLAPFIEWAQTSGEGNIAGDIIARYGEGRRMSYKQGRLLVRLHRQSLAHDERKAKWAEEKANAPALVEGRQEIEGVILKVEERDSDWGIQFKMTVKMDNGNVLWGTLPSAVSSADRGDRIAFTATVQVSDRDENFGFIRRPSKARLVQPATDDN
jgi:hypothetical protein